MMAMMSRMMKTPSGAGDLGLAEREASPTGWLPNVDPAWRISSTLTPYSLDRATSISTDGSASPHSHLETACLVTNTFDAR